MMKRNTFAIGLNLFTASMVVLFIVAILAISGFFMVQQAVTINPDFPTASPFTANFLFGTDDLGRDLLARIAVGAQISLAIGLATAVVAMVFGTIYGIVAAYLGGWVERAMMAFIDIIYSLPGLMVVILVSLFFGRGVLSLVFALALFSWPDTARIVRGQVLALQKEEFIEAFHSLGGQAGRLFWYHFLPNLAGLLILTTTMTVPRAILTESTLSFIGLGVEPPLSSWGTLASEGWQLVRVAPHMLIIPAGFIFITMVALNVLGDVLRSQYDPKVS